MYFIMALLTVLRQVRVLKNYPSKLLFITLQCFLSTIQLFAIAVAAERDPREWELGWNVRLLAVAYCVNYLSTLYSVFFASHFSH
jgi:hypothetical protein